MGEHFFSLYIEKRRNAIRRVGLFRDSFFSRKVLPRQISCLCGYWLYLSSATNRRLFCLCESTFSIPSFVFPNPKLHPFQIPNCSRYFPLFLSLCLNLKLTMYTFCENRNFSHAYKVNNKPSSTTVFFLTSLFELHEFSSHKVLGSKNP